MATTRKKRRTPAEQPIHRYVPPGGQSRTIAGAIKVFAGLAVQTTLKITGWALPETMDQLEVVETVGMLMALGLEVWGGIQVVHARQSRGDLSATGTRVSAVEVIVAPEAAPPPPVTPLSNPPRS